MSVNKASVEFEVPRRTLKGRVDHGKNPDCFVTNKEDGLVAYLVFITEKSLLLLLRYNNGIRMDHLQSNLVKGVFDFPR